TLAGFRHARSVGAPWVEFDTQLSADKHCIVFHDDKLDRTTNGSGSVCDTAYQTIARLDAGAWFGPAFAGERVPSLKQTLALLLDLGLHPDIEIKPAEGHEAETARAVIGEAMALWPASAPPPLITSIKHECLLIAGEMAPDWPRGLICFRFPRGWRRLLERLSCEILICHHRLLSRRRVAEITDAGYQLMAFTVNQPRRATTLLSWGVSTIITDGPEDILAVTAGS
ncbi:MAG: glycerophosphoryl diester phosphodiesterase, partial [Proteobacteria bacterium]|nr:glycerophosphoryl diester phosphodiesterase [Pseudomonadota bacterium]